MLSVKKLLYKLLETTAWTNITLPSGFTSRGNNRYRKVRGMVEVEFHWSNPTHFSTFTVFGTLPQGYRPAGYIVVACQGNSSNVMTVHIYPNGNIAVWSSAATAAYYRGYALFIPA